MYRIEHLYWEDERAPKAAGAGNDRDLGPAKRWRFMSNCRHWRQRFELEKGISVYASAWLDCPDAKLFRKPAGFSGPPEIGLYFDVKWASDRLVLSPGFRPPFGREKGDTRMILYPWRDFCSKKEGAIEQ